MLKRRVLAMVICGTTAVVAVPFATSYAESPGAPSSASVPYFVKTAASLADLEKTLEGKGAHSAEILKPGASALEIVWRHEEDYEQKELEVHDAKDHVFLVTDGAATFTLGGKLTDPREISVGEWRAARSIDSKTVDVHKGDLVFIPHGTVHGRSAKGRRFTMLQLSFWAGGAPMPKAPPGSGPGEAAASAVPRAASIPAGDVPAARSPSEQK